MANAFQDWEYLFVEAMFVLDTQNPQELSNRVMFFDHYAKAYRGRKSDLDNYFTKLIAEGWELTGGPWSYDNPDRNADEAARPVHPMLTTYLCFIVLLAENCIDLNARSSDRFVKYIVPK